VVVFEAKPGRPASVESVPVTAGRRLRDVAGSLEELERQAEDLGDAFLRVTVKAEAPSPDLADRVKERLPNALDVTVDYPKATALAPGGREGRRTEQEPLELFRRYYRQRHETELPADLATLFQSLYEEAGR
jgi:hypothetical protein